MVKYIFNELFAEPTRMVMTILAVAWGTASIAVMLASGEGLRLTFGRAMRGPGEGILIVRNGQTSKAYAGLPEGRPIRLNPQDLQAARESIPEIGLISGEYSTWKPMSYSGNWYSGPVSGVDPDFGKMRNIILQSGGRFINPQDLKLRRRIVVIGSGVADRLFDKNVNPVGRHLDLDGRLFLVVGVLKKKYQLSTFGAPDRDAAWIPSTTFQTMYGYRYYTNWVVKPLDPSQMGRLKKRITELTAHRHGANPEDDDIVTYVDTQNIQKTTDSIFYGLQTLLGIIGGLTLIVAGVGIANVMYVSVTNATRDIGIRMAVGAHAYHVLLQYTLESLFATAIGGALGMLIGAAVITGIGQIPMDGEFFDFVGSPKPVLSTTVAFLVVTVLGIVGFFAGVFPARRAARVEPTEALRYE